MSLRLLRTRLCTTVAALALFVGCDSDSSKPPAKPTPAVQATPPAPAAQATPPAPAPTQPAAPAVTMTGEGSVVALLDPGVEPRAPLRLKLAAGQQQAMVMTMRMAMAMDIAGTKAPKTTIPPMEMTMNLRVTEITGEGDIVSTFSLDSIEVLSDPAAPAEVVNQLRSMLGTMTKMSGTSTITPRGIVKAADFNIPADVNPQLKQTMDSMRQQINQLAVPFPEEALGVGARWTVTQHLEQQGMKLQQVATWELKGREGDVVKLASTIVQNAEPQAIAAPGMPPGTSVNLDRLSSTGSGTTELDLGRVAPTRGSMTLTSSVAMTTNANGTKMPMTMDMDLGLEITGK